MERNINHFENILNNVINKIPNNAFLKIEFVLFDNSDFGGESFEFMSMIITYLNKLDKLSDKNDSEYAIDQELYDICQKTDTIKYDEYISSAMNKTMNDERILVIDNR